VLVLQKFVAMRSSSVVWSDDGHTRISSDIGIHTPSRFAPSALHRGASGLPLGSGEYGTETLGSGKYGTKTLGSGKYSSSQRVLVPLPRPGSSKYSSTPEWREGGGLGGGGGVGGGGEGGDLSEFRTRAPLARDFGNDLGIVLSDITTVHEAELVSSVAGRHAQPPSI
jgi:hypothetical protein